MQVTERCWCGCSTSFWETEYNTPTSIRRAARPYQDRPSRAYRHCSRSPVQLTENRPCPRRLEPVLYRFVILTSIRLRDVACLRHFRTHRSAPFLSPVQGTLSVSSAFMFLQGETGWPRDYGLHGWTTLLWREPVTSYPFGPCCQSYPNDPMRPNSELKEPKSVSPRC